MRYLMCILLLIVMMNPVLLYSDSSLQYKSRGNRNEGILPKPISGYDIELISFQALYSNRSVAFNPNKSADYARFKFYLQKEEKVWLLLREINDEKYYRADSFKPDKPWQTGFDNEFVLPVKDVMKPLGLHPSQIGVIARLRREGPSQEEYAAPVVFTGEKYPDKVSGYLFHLKTAQEAVIKYKIVQPESKKTFIEGKKKSDGFSSLALVCDMPDAPDGNYQLVLQGYFVSDNSPILKVIHFYHKAEVQ